MNIAFASAPWPRAAAVSRPWRFAREVERGLERRLQRNVSLSPGQLFGVCPLLHRHGRHTGCAELRAALRFQSITYDSCEQ